ncbi:unnamed protein product [Gongylonema pulchrum]|uniref:BTB domain-containing protein n=1 Tax=Gongylonema pulchrum TaxID=637853 RepID=A0A183DBZ1_9BILA|nr:unnamed protein product [Gongylonema pulchrum]
MSLNLPIISGLLPEGKNALIPRTSNLVPDYVSFVVSWLYDKDVGDVETHWTGLNKEPLSMTSVSRVRFDATCRICLQKYRIQALNVCESSAAT